MNTRWIQPAPRRAFLRGLGALMALPHLESWAEVSSAASSAASSPGLAGASPRRLAFVYVPNGVNMADWTPAGEGSAFELPAILEPLSKVRGRVNVLSGLAQDSGRAYKDGAGDHARASATWLTSRRIRKTNGADIQAGVSVDQLTAKHVGRATRFPSLELGCDRGQLSGNCDSGYSCAYSFNVSWRAEATPMPPEVDPRLAFDRLFSNGDPNETAENRAVRERYQKSVLDFVMADARELSRKLGRNDQRKLDEYLTSVRDLERRIEAAEHSGLEMPGQERPAGIPKEYARHIRLMYDLMALAFQTDSTRIASFIVAHDGSNRPYPFIGVSDGHHDLSHHQNDPEKKARIAKINRFHMEQFAYFLEKLESIREGQGTLLDQCMIVYGSGLADGNGHEHHNLPTLLAGRGGGSLTTGQHIRHPKDTPMANLFLSLMDRMGVNEPRFGDSTGRLKSIDA